MCTTSARQCTPPSRINWCLISQIPTSCICRTRTLATRQIQISIPYITYTQTNLASTQRIWRQINIAFARHTMQRSLSKLSLRGWMSAKISRRHQAICSPRHSSSRLYTDPSTWQAKTSRTVVCGYILGTRQGQPSRFILLNPVHTSASASIRRTRASTESATRWE